VSGHGGLGVRCVGRELRFPSRTYFSYKRLHPALRGLQENAVLVGEVRLRAGAAHCAVDPPPILATIRSRRPATDHHAGCEAHSVAPPQG